MNTLSNPQPTGLTGLERITALEVEIRALRNDVGELKTSSRAVEDLMKESRGAMRLIHYAAGIAGLLTAGWVGHGHISDFLKWVGR